jgi:hypothetical protein
VQLEHVLQIERLLSGAAAADAVVSGAAVGFDEDLLI